MGDGFGEGLATVVAIIIVAALAISVVIFVIPFILYALVVYNGGVKFSGQLRSWTVSPSRTPKSGLSTKLSSPESAWG